MSEIIDKPPLVELYMIRHAESQTNLDRGIIAGRDTLAELSPRGELQAERLGEWLSAEGICPDEVYASPATRTRRTAEICLRAMDCGVTPLIDERLPEVSQGIWEGRRRSHVYRPTILAQIARQRRDFHAPEGESINMAHERMRAFIDDIARTAPAGEPSKTIFAFTHGYATRILVGSMLGWSLNDIRGRETPNASPTLLTYDGERWTPRYVGRSVAAVPTPAS